MTARPRKCTTRLTIGASNTCHGHYTSPPTDVSIHCTWSINLQNPKTSRQLRLSLKSHQPLRYTKQVPRQPWSISWISSRPSPKNHEGLSWHGFTGGTCSSLPHPLVVPWPGQTLQMNFSSTCGLPSHSSSSCYHYLFQPIFRESQPCGIDATSPTTWLQPYSSGALAGSQGKDLQNRNQNQKFAIIDNNNNNNNNRFPLRHSPHSSGLNFDSLKSWLPLRTVFSASRPLWSSNLIVSPLFIA